MNQVETPQISNWLRAIRRYLLATTAGSLVWEMVQMPLYTIWREGSVRDIVQAILHCTVGDALIAIIAIVAALILVGSPAWPDQRFGAVLASTIALATGYSIYSEYWNTVVRQNWAYNQWMPTLPWLGTGLTPLAQWVVIPTLGLIWSRRGVDA